MIVKNLLQFVDQLINQSAAYDIAARIDGMIFRAQNLQRLGIIFKDFGVGMSLDHILHEAQK